jgi:hypothetical protein
MNEKDSERLLEIIESAKIKYLREDNDEAFKACNNILESVQNVINLRETRKEAWEDKDTVVTLAGDKHYFRCPCGCNVFKKSLVGDNYKCNSCKSVYEGE